MRSISAGWRFRTGSLAVLLLLSVVVAPALAAILQMESFEEDPFPVWPPEELEEGEEEPPPPWDPDWVDVRTADIDNTSIVTGYFGGGLQIDLPDGSFRGTGARYRLPGDPVDEVWFRYLLRLNNWQTTSSGKLPGPAGLYSASGRGCIPSTEALPGWSARMQFTPTGTAGAGPDATTIGYYIYHLDQPGNCGETMLWDPGVVDHNRWYCVEGHVRLNTPGGSDGQVRGWLDGELAMQRDGMSFRRDTEPNVAIREFWLNVYHGGVNPAANDMDLTIDELVVSDSGRQPCPDPFDDDDGSVHEPALTELKARDIYFGCFQGVSCLDEALARYAMAVLLDRALGLPATSENFFTDDEIWAEPMINRLAAAGITFGCGDGEFCPLENITRGQFALMLDRSFAFPASSTDYFSDDDGHKWEDTFNELAEAGITFGCRSGEFCPVDDLSRGQAASFILRALEWAEGAES